MPRLKWLEKIIQVPINIHCMREQQVDGYLAKELEFNAEMEVLRFIHTLKTFENIISYPLLLLEFYFKWLLYPSCDD